MEKELGEAHGERRRWGEGMGRRGGEKGKRAAAAVGGGGRRPSGDSGLGRMGARVCQDCRLISEKLKEFFAKIATVGTWPHCFRHVA